MCNHGPNLSIDHQYWPLDDVYTQREREREKVDALPFPKEQRRNTSARDHVSTQAER